MIKLKAGFTLIELMVVVVIVGLLVASAVIVFSKNQQRARDARRVQDIADIFDSLKIYYQQRRFYPQAGNDCSLDGGAEIYDTSNCDNRGDWIADNGQYLAIKDELTSNGYMKYL